MRRLLIGVAAATLLTAGCSSGSDTDASGEAAGAANAQPSGATDFEAYRQCLSENGVDVSALGGGRGNSGGQPPNGMPTDRPTDLPSGMPTDRPTDFPSGMPTDLPSGMPADGTQGGPGGGPGGGFFGTEAPDGVDADTWQAAQEACADLRPSGGPGGQAGQGGLPGPASSAAAGAAALTVFWSCMSDHDVKQTASGLIEDLDESDDTVAAALKICSKLLPDSDG